MFEWPLQQCSAVTLKMHDLKITEKENYGVWKMQEWKMTDKNYGVWEMQD